MGGLARNRRKPDRHRPVMHMVDRIARQPVRSGDRSVTLRVIRARRVRAWGLLLVDE